MIGLVVLKKKYIQRSVQYVKGATPRFAHLEKLRLNFSISLFVIRVNLLHP